MSENQQANDPREQLNALLQTNLTEYHKMLQGFPADMLIDMAGHIAAVAEVFEYLTTQHEFRAGEVEHLLSSENPLDELADAWQVQREDKADMGFIVRAFYAEKEYQQQTPLEQLMTRLEQNVIAYEQRILAKPPNEIMNRADEISAVTSIHYYLTKRHSFVPEEVEYLLRFQDPLDVVSTAWRDKRDSFEDMAAVLEGIIGSDHYLLVYENTVLTKPAAEEQPQKPSIRDLLREGSEQAKQQSESTPHQRQQEETL